MDRDEATARFNLACERFGRLMPPDRDPLVLLLKGHLLIEEQLHLLISAGVAEPAALGSARLSFSQKLQLAKAVGGAFIAADLHATIRRINGMRNTIAHQVEPAAGDALYCDFLAWCRAQARFQGRFPTDATVAGQLYHVLLVCWTTLATMRDVVQVVRELHPMPPPGSEERGADCGPPNPALQPPPPSRRG